ncbi:dephospho-CoA kinase [Prochlorococcus marinus]|uniref:Dephospho-CoA kinase n=1 Tax=Prochlorococcus marinus (strain MIT 9211) TaxID=93059 RepID=A9B9F0_PROM4|nr:dephospho-CoA kinase [Prochlorococcus marinus]ABX07987.1 putative dephospho-CoA kinase [Prochlorococcus marinus str. MIT 9211]
MQRWQGSQRRIGITGGIASGKSTVGSYLAINKGLPILDADLFARDALQPGTPAANAVLKRFKNRIISTNKDRQLIDRHKLGEIIFGDKNERRWIENLIHPIVRKRFSQELNLMQREPIVILIIPLLFEADLTSLCSEIWVISSTRETQMNRLLKRDGLSRNSAENRINAQWPLELKKRLGDTTIENNNELQKLYLEIDKLL